MSYIVSLDLGSESMAACLHYTGTVEIGLQHYGPILALRQGQSVDDLALLRDGKRLSCRLLSRLMTRPGQQPPQLGRDHALLDFVAGDTKQPAYDSQCLFQYFPDTRLRAQLDKYTLPNPKVIFHAGAGDLLPAPESTQAGVPVSLRPDDVVQHIAAQVIRNFIMRSPLLKGASGQDVHLVLTVPNVYSVLHAVSLVRFLEELRKDDPVYVPERISWLYESDAIAHSIFHEETRLLRERRLERKGKPDHSQLPLMEQLSERLANGEEVHLVTVDIGRGTTDMSWVRLRGEMVGGRLSSRTSHEVIARTGRSEGGNRLTYLFVERFYEPMMRWVFATYGSTIGLAESPFSFVERKAGETQPTADQGPALAALETLVGSLKSAVRKDYSIDWERGGTGPEADPAGLRDDLRHQEARLLKEIIAGLRREAEDKSNAQFTPEFEDTLLKALSMPAKGLMMPRRGVLRTGAGQPLHSLGVIAANTKRKLLRTLKAESRNHEPHSDPNASISADVEAKQGELIADLREAVQEYVKRNTTELLTDLRHSAGAALIGADCYVVPFGVVAGQAAQFAPLRESLVEWFKLSGHINSEEVNAPLAEWPLEFLDGAEAKMACAVGAVQYVLNDALNSQEAAIIGTYGFRRQTGMAARFHPMPLDKLNSGEAFVCVADRLGAGTIGAEAGDFHWVLVYSPDHYVEGTPVPERGDNKTAYLEPVTGNLILAKYDRSSRKLLVAAQRGATDYDIINARADAEAYFRSASCHMREITPAGADRPDPRSDAGIYAKVWPEKLPAEGALL